MSNNRSTPLEEVIFYVIDQTAKKQKQYSQKQFDLLGINVTVDQWVILKTVDEFEPVSQTDLALKSLKDNASITRILDILERKELIQRNSDDVDRRKYLITLSKKGRYFIERNMDLVSDLRKRGVKGMSEKDLKSLKSLLHQIQQNMS